MTSAPPSSTATAVILAAGMGKRMKSGQPKALQLLANQPIITHLLATARTVFEHIVIVIGPDMDDLAELVAPCATVIQQERLGTGHAARAAEALFGTGDVVFLYADNPLLTADTMRRLLEARTKGDSLSLLGMRPEHPAQYGRIITAPDGTVQRIVEYRDATPEERSIPLCNAGMMCARADALRRWLAVLSPNNTQGEYYLTDIVAHAAEEGRVVCIEAEEEELTGINSRAELARAEAILQQRLRQRAMEGGATLIDPSSVFFSADTHVGMDVVIEPNVFFGLGVDIADGCWIRAFSHLEGCRIEEGCVIGPYARLRPGTHCAAGSHVGNFVELKNTRLGEGSKANHLSYLGDTIVGRHVNIGAGSITCNYDGVSKHHTHIGDDSFIGSDSILVAPVSIGAEAVIAAGSVITDDVEAGAMAFGRAFQKNKAGRGIEHRRILKKRKEQG